MWKGLSQSLQEKDSWYVTGEDAFACYRIYGCTVESSFPFRYNLNLSTEAPDLTFVYEGVVPERRPPGLHVYSSSEPNERDRSAVDRAGSSH